MVMARRNRVYHLKGSEVLKENLSPNVNSSIVSPATKVITAAPKDPILLAPSMLNSDQHTVLRVVEEGRDETSDSMA
ncbi:hypothetical protein V6N13_057014 [Hibiscus sabdariffa]